MPDHNISPVHDSPNSEGNGHYRVEDDIELPPIPESDSTVAEGAAWPRQADRHERSVGISSILGGAVLVGALVVGGWFALRGGSLEQQHPNWQHVSAATEASDSGPDQLVHVKSSGNPQAETSIDVSAADADKDATRQVRRALMRNDVVTATAALQAAQSIPTAAQDSDVQPPVITQGSDLAKRFREGRQELFQIELFDCCHEDGDVVEVTVNGATFATVPIGHGGTMLSIPLARGHNTVTVRGVKDGRGGVTVSFRTSRGDYFARSMRVGEEHQMGVVVQ